MKISRNGLLYVVFRVCFSEPTKPVGVYKFFGLFIIAAIVDIFLLVGFVACSVIAALLVAHRPSLCDGDPDPAITPFVPYRRWPRIRGYLVTPVEVLAITAVVTVVIVYQDFPKMACNLILFFAVLGGTIRVAATLKTKAGRLAAIKKRLCPIVDFTE